MTERVWGNAEVYSVLFHEDRPDQSSLAYRWLGHIATHVESGRPWNDRALRPVLFHAGAYHSLYARVKRALGGAK